MGAVQVVYQVDDEPEAHFYFQDAVQAAATKLIAMGNDRYYPAEPYADQAQFFEALETGKDPIYTNWIVMGEVKGMIHIHEHRVTPECVA